MTETKPTRRVRLGDYIESRNERNSDLRFGPELIEGVNNNGEFQPTRANTIGIDMKPYKAVYPGDFVYNPSRLNIGSISYRQKGMCIVSHLYVVFYIKEEKREELLPDYLWLFLHREEFLRMVDYHNYGSQRAEFNIHDLGEFEIPLPGIEVQRELVEAYNGLKALAEQNEALVPQLSAACHAYIVDCREKYPSVPLGDYIEQCDDRAGDKFSVDDVTGISIEKKLMPTKANMDGVSLSPYKLLKHNEFCYVTVTSRNGGKISLAINSTNQTKIVSSSYIVFRSKDEDVLLPEYLFLFLGRTEFDRYARFNSWGSARETFDWSEMCRVEIPLPPIEVQQAIVDVFNCAERAKKIAAEARARLKTICSALVRRAANS